MSGLNINLAPIAAISDADKVEAEGDAPPPRYSEVVEDQDVELGAGGDSGNGRKWRERLNCSRPNRDTMKKLLVVLLVLVIFVTFILAIVNSVRICEQRYAYC